MNPGATRPAQASFPNAGPGRGASTVGPRVVRSGQVTPDAASARAMSSGPACVDLNEHGAHSDTGRPRSRRARRRPRRGTRTRSARSWTRTAGSSTRTATGCSGRSTTPRTRSRRRSCARGARSAGPLQELGTHVAVPDRDQRLPRRAAAGPQPSLRLGPTGRPARRSWRAARRVRLGGALSGRRVRPPRRPCRARRALREPARPWSSPSSRRCSTSRGTSARC